VSGRLVALRLLRRALRSGPRLALRGATLSARGRHRALDHGSDGDEFTPVRAPASAAGRRLLRLGKPWRPESRAALPMPEARRPPSGGGLPSPASFRASCGTVDLRWLSHSVDLARPAPTDADECLWAKAIVRSGAPKAESDDGRVGSADSGLGLKLLEAVMPASPSGAKVPRAPTIRRLAPL
jgi:hypothetical protein